jgi:hypothetical protein
MIPAPSSILETDNLDAIEEIEFGISDPRKMMQIGARQYSNPEGAVARELATNAYDAHVEAGNSAPIEVTLPTMFDPLFKVTDYGTGMSLEDFRNVYTQFGYSTKEHTNEQTGMLGLGSKAPLAYTDQFLISTVKDGFRTEGVVTRRPDWSIGMKITLHKYTGEPSGTVVTVPVHNVEEFIQKANDMYVFWLPGRILVDGVEPEHNVGKKIAENFYYSNHYSRSYVVMGNVPYRLNNPYELFKGSKINPINFVAYVGMDNGVDFTPAREDLEYTERTKDRLRGIIKEFEQQIVTKAQSEIDKATSHHEAYAAFSEWGGVLGSGLFFELQFRGDKFEPQFKLNAFKYKPGGRRGSSYTVYDLFINNCDNALFVVNHPSGASANSGQKLKVRDWMTLKGRNHSSIYFTGHSAASIPKWINPANIVKWETIKAEVPKTRPTGAGTGNRIPGSWDYITNGEVKKQQSIPATGKLFWVNRRTFRDHHSLQKRMRLFGLTDAVVIDVPGNRLEKFKRDNPSIENFTEHTKKLVELDGEKLLSDEAKLYLSIEYAEVVMLSTLDTSRIDDPDWTKNLDIIRNKESLLTKYKENETLVKSAGLWYNYKQYQSGSSSPMFDRYPLMRLIDWTPWRGNPQFDDDVYLYINAKYAERENNNVSV